MRPIDADKLREAMYHEAFETDSDMQKWDSGCWIRYKMFENNLDNATTVEAEPVRYGKWEYIGGYGYQYRCTNCVMCVEQKTQYCPHCGARME